MDKDEIERRVVEARISGRLAVEEWGLFNVGQSVTADTLRLLEAVFPELFDGTHWLAPRDPEFPVIVKGCEAINIRPSETKAVWDAMRDAYLGAKP